MKYLNRLIQQSFLINPKIFGIDDAIVVGLVTLIGTVTSSAMAADSAKKNANNQIDAANRTNAISQADWEKEQEQKKKEFAITTAQKNKEDFQSTLDRYPGLQKNFIDIWGGK